MSGECEKFPVDDVHISCEKCNHIWYMLTEHAITTLDKKTWVIQSYFCKSCAGIKVSKQRIG